MIENTIIRTLMTDEEYVRKVLPYLSADYFTDLPYKVLFKVISTYINKYNTLPSKEAVQVQLSNIDGLNEKLYYKSNELLQTICKESDLTANDRRWLIDSTETFCQDKALYNAIMKSIEVMDDKSSNSQVSKGAIPKMLQDALSVTFDSSIGHDYVDDAMARFEFYHKKEEKIPFDLHLFNKITKGGVSRKTLTVILAGTAVGKSLFMCHCAAGNLALGKNVLYITLEMSEEKIAERIDANLLDVTMDELYSMRQSEFLAKITNFKKRNPGKLIIKEYPTASASVLNFRALIEDLRIKKNFVPDVVYVDYLNICSSARVKAAVGVSSYTYVKAISEELRGLAIEFDVPVITATQTNRAGYSNSDVELTDTSESFGVPMSADIMFALINNEELQDLNQILVKQLKNRYDDIGKLKRFVIGIDRNKMRLYDVEDSAQDGLMDDGPVFDKGSFSGQDFSGFKV